MSETPQQYLARNLANMNKKEKEKEVKEPGCINLYPNIWKAMQTFIKDYNRVYHIKLSRNQAFELACKELLTKYNIKW